MITELSVNGIIEHYLSASTKPKNTDERIMEKIDANSWQSQYRRYKRTSF